MDIFDPTKLLFPRYYQLTHDYLVPSLRTWLTRKQRETHRGRAEIRLAERSEAWNRKPENRQLPAGWEYLSIRLFTRKGDWSQPQHTMMRRATRYYTLRAAVATAVLLLLGWGGWEGYGTLRGKQIVKSLLRSETAAVEQVLDEAALNARWVSPRVSKQLRTVAKDSKEELHLRLAALVLGDSTHTVGHRDTWERGESQPQ